MLCIFMVLLFNVPLRDVYGICYVDALQCIVSPLGWSCGNGSECSQVISMSNIYALEGMQKIEILACRPIHHYYILLHTVIRSC